MRPSPLYVYLETHAENDEEEWSLVLKTLLTDIWKRGILCQCLTFVIPLI